MKTVMLGEIKMKMPKLTPLPIKTKSHSLWVRIFRWITSIRQWKLIDNWYFILPDGTKIVIPKSFVFDGASIPRVLWGVLSPTGLLLIPGLVHDFGYRYTYLWAIDDEGNLYKYGENEGKEHKFWDKVFKDVGKEINGMAIIDACAYLMLVLFGSVAWNNNRKKNAPEIKPNL